MPPLPYLTLAMGAAFSHLAAGQTQLPIGAWEQVPVSPASSSFGPFGFYSHRPVSIAGSYLTAGADAPNTSFAFQFDASSSLWSKYPAYPAGIQPYELIAFGGYLIGLTQAMDVLSITSTDSYASPGAAWVSVPLANRPPTRYHSRVAAFGGILYLFGGATQPYGANSLAYNDLWGMDINDALGAALSGRAAVGWVQLIANGTAGMPRQRAGHLMLAEGRHIYIYGGWEPGAPPSPSGGPGIFVSDHMWAFMPGNNFDNGGLVSKTFAPAQFTLQPAVAMYGAGQIVPDYTRNGIPALAEATGSVYGGE